MAEIFYYLFYIGPRCHQNYYVLLCLDKTVNSTGNEPPELASDKGILVYISTATAEMVLLSYISVCQHRDRRVDITVLY